MYRVSSTDSVTMINGYKYRESVGNHKSQLVFDSKMYPQTEQEVTKYDKYNLIHNNHWWNLETTQSYIPLYEHNISSHKELVAHYAHNIMVQAENDVYISVMVNGNIMHYNKGTTDSAFITLPKDNWYNIKLALYNPYGTQVSIKSHIGNGYKQNANCWLWYKEKEDETINYDILNKQKISIILPIINQDAILKFI